ncbi:MAG: hypothetical protein R2682_13615 [Pyrinomonadaceae bacterium]
MNTIFANHKLTDEEVVQLSSLQNAKQLNPTAVVPTPARRPIQILDSRVCGRQRSFLSA